jgi:hypothetical protein
MVKDKIKNAVRPTAHKLINLNRKLAVNTIMLRTFLASAFFMISLGIFTTLLRRGDDLLKSLVIVYGLILLLFFSYNIITYLVNITRVALSKAANFPFILFVNTFLGFIAQLFFFNLTLAIVVRTLAYIRHASSFVCEFKCSVVSFYYNTEVYTQINSLIWWVTLGTIAAFIIGNYMVWLRDNR